MQQADFDWHVDRKINGETISRDQVKWNRYEHMYNVCLPGALIGLMFESEYRDVLFSCLFM